MAKIYGILTPSLLKDRNTDEINGLLGQLSDRAQQYSRQDIENFLNQPNFYPCVCWESGIGGIIGMAVLKIDNTRMFTQNYIKGYVGDVVVNENHRGKGIAEELMRYLIALAKSIKLANINLTSNQNNPKRCAAIKLYEKLGFELIGKVGDSNYYRLKL